MKKTLIVILFLAIVPNLQSQDNNSNIAEKNFMLFLSFGTSTYPFHTPAKDQSSFDFGFREIGLQYKFPNKVYIGASYCDDSYPNIISKAVIEPGEIEVEEYEYNSFSSVNLSAGYFINNDLSVGVQLGNPVSSDYRAPYSFIVNSTYTIVSKNQSSLMLQPEIKFSMRRNSQTSPSTHFGLNVVFYFGL